MICKPLFLRLSLLISVAAPAMAGISAFPSGTVRNEPSTDAIISLIDRLPSEVVSFTSSAQRLDMLDYFKASNERPTKNLIDVDMRIVACSPQRVTFISADSLYCSDISMVTDGKDTLLVVTDNVVLNPELTPRLTLGMARVFDASGHELGTVSCPPFSRWIEGFDKLNTDSINRVALQLPFVVAEARFDPQTLTLTFSQRMDNYYPTGEKPPVIEKIRPTLSFVLRGKKFKPIK